MNRRLWFALGIWAILVAGELLVIPAVMNSDSGVIPDKSSSGNSYVHYIPPVREQGFRKGPYLQNVTLTTITISFELYDPAPALVHYGITPSMTRTAYSNNSATFHEVSIRGLTPSTLYYYQVDAGGIQSPQTSFRTAKQPWEAFKLVFYGDSRSNPSTHAAICAAISSENPDLVFNDGDMVYDGNEDSQWDDMHFGPAGGLMNHVPMYVTLGNHEHHAEQYFKYFQNPGPDGEEKWYSIDYANAHIISLSSQDDYLQGSAQYQWLEQDLQAAQNESKWIFAFWHVPPYNTGVSHGTGNPTSGPEGTDQRDSICALLEHYGAQMVFNGHEHIYQHAFVNNVHYVITGGGGAFLSYYGGSHDWTVVCSDRSYHYVILDFDNPWHVTFTAKRLNGSIIEQFEQSIPPWDGPPAPPTDFYAEDQPGDNGGSIRVSWTPSADDGQDWDDVESYEVERAESAQGPFQTVSTLPAGSKEYYDLNVNPNTDYYYKVKVNDASYSAETPVFGPVQAIDNIPPLAPSSIRASDVPDDDGGAINVAWDTSPSPDVMEYRLYRSTSNDITNTSIPIKVLDSSTNEYTDTSVQSNVNYYYGISAWDGTYLSPVTVSSPAMALWDGAPAAPTLKTVQDVPGDSGTSLKLVWRPSPDDGSGGDVTEYHIYRANASDMNYKMIHIAVAGETEYTDTGLSPDSGGYYYFIRAFDSTLESQNSNIIGPVIPIDNLKATDPTDLIVRNIGDTWAELKWTSDGVNTAGYNVYLNGTADDWDLAAEVTGSTKTTVRVGNLAYGTTYYAVVTAVSDRGKETKLDPDTAVEFTTLNPPIIKSVDVSPGILPNDGTPLSVTVRVLDNDGVSDVTSVSCEIMGLSVYADLERKSQGSPDFEADIPIERNTKPGTYTMKVTAMDSTGLMRHANKSIVIVDADSLKNHRPTIDRVQPGYSTIRTTAGSTVSFEVAPDDPDEGDSLSVKWLLNGVNVGKGNELEHQFSENGTYTMVAVVTDSAGESASVTWNIIVGNQQNTQLEDNTNSDHSTKASNNSGVAISTILIISVIITTVIVAILVVYLRKKGIV